MIEQTLTEELKEQLRPGSLLVSVDSKRVIMVVDTSIGEYYVYDFRTNSNLIYNFFFPQDWTVVTL